MDSTLFSFSFNNQVTYVSTPKSSDPRRPEIVKAIRSNNVEALKELLINYKEINLLDQNNDTPLMVAAQTPYPHMIDLLIAHGANPNTANSYDGTPLTFAIAYKCLPVIEALLKAGAHVNLKHNLFKINILKDAVKTADPNIICAIIKKGAIVDYAFYLKMQKKAFKQPNIFQPVIELLLTNEQIAAQANAAKNRVAKLYADELKPGNIQFGPLEKDLYTQQLQWIAKFALRHPNSCHFYEENDELIVQIKELKINLTHLLSQSNLSHVSLSQKDSILFIKTCTLSQKQQNIITAQLPANFTLPKKELTPAEKLCVNDYTQDDHKSINSILHANPPEGEKNLPNFYCNNFLKMMFIASGLNKITPSWTRNLEDLTPQTVTYRGEKHIHADEINQRIEKLNANLSDIIQKQPGFASTSTNLDVSKKFDGKLCRIEYDKIYGKNIQLLSAHENEEEYLQLPGFIHLLSHSEESESHVFKAQCLTPLFTSYRSVQHEHEFSILKTFASASAIPNDVAEKEHLPLFLEGLLPQCQFVFTHFLSKDYTDTSYIGDWEHITYFGKTLPRPNHNMPHVMRVAQLVPLVAQFLTAHGYCKFTQREINIVQLTALFSVVGRQNEIGFKDMKADNSGYKLFKQESGNQFACYVNHTRFLNMPSEEIKLYSHNIMKMGEPGENHPTAVLLALAHKLDLLRCYEPDRVKNDIINVLELYIADHADIEKLMDYAESLLHATGNRVMYGKEITDNYNDDLFYAVSTNVKTCYRAISSVPMPTPNAKITNTAEKRKGEDINEAEQPQTKKQNITDENIVMQVEHKKNSGNLLKNP